MKYFKYFLALIIGFIVIYLGSVDIPGALLPLIYGPYPIDGNVPFLRIFTDFWISFVFTMLGGYLAAAISPARPLTFGVSAGLLYFFLSAYWYSGYGLVGSEWISPSIMLIKVPVAAYLGAYIYTKYNKAQQADG